MGTFDGLFSGGAATTAAPAATSKPTTDRFASLFAPVAKPPAVSTPTSVPMKTWQGQQIPATIVTKNLVSYDPATGNKTFNLGNAGPGVYTEDANGKIVNQGHTTYGGVPAKPGFERADIIPVSLGGTNSNKGNIAYEPLLPKNQQKPGQLTQSDVALDAPGGINDQLKSGQLQPKAAINAQLAEQDSHNFPNTQAPSFWQKVGSVLSDTADALGKVGLGVVHEDMGATGTTVGGKKVPSTIANPFQVALAADAEIPGAIKKAAFGTLIAPLLGAGAQVKQQFGGQGQIDLSKIGIPKVDSFSRNVQANVDSGMPAWEAIVMEVPNIVAAGMGLDAIGTHSSLTLGDIAQEKTTTPITFKDMQNITTGKENLVAPDVLKAYKTATIENPDLLGQVRQGTVEAPNAPKATLFSNFLKNAATRPVSEVANIFNTFGRDVSVPNTPLLPEKITPTEASNLPADTIRQYVPAVENGKSVYIVKNLPAVIEPRETSLATIPQPKSNTISGNGFTVTDKANPQMVKIGKALNDYRSAVQTYNQKPTPAKLAKALAAKTAYTNLRQPPASAPFAHEMNTHTGVQPFAHEINGANAPFAHEITQAVPAAKPIPAATAEAKPIEPVASKPTEPGKTPSKIGQSIEQKAVEAKLTSGYEGVAGYDKITIKDQAEKATNLINTNLDQARAIIRGDQSLPDGLKGTALITAMEEYIKTHPDSGLSHELANSPLVSGTSAAAQEMRLAAERTPDSAAAKLQEIRKAQLEKAGGRKAVTQKKADVLKQLKEATNKINLSKEELSWDKFLNEIQC